MWNGGSTARTRSLPGSRTGGSPRVVSRHWLVAAERLAWVNMAPFGNPVVPPVYWRTAKSWNHRVRRQHDLLHGPQADVPADNKHLSFHDLLANDGIYEIYPITDVAGWWSLCAESKARHRSDRWRLFAERQSERIMNLHVAPVCVE